MMVTCPNCQLANPDGAESCARCGQPRFVIESPSGDIPVLSAATGAVISAPTPGAMAAPFLSPRTPPPDSTPLPSHPGLDLSPVRSGGAGVTRPEPPSSDVTPAPLLLSAAPSTIHEVKQPPAAGPVTIRNRVAATGLAAAVEPIPVTKPEPTPTPPPRTEVPPEPPPLQVKLVVIRGLKIGAEYPIYEGRNSIGRFVDKPVDIDLITQESVEQTWCSRAHASLTLNNGVVTVEDLNSLNGTWLNGARIHPGQPRAVQANDVLQVGTVQLKVIVFSGVRGA
jgi:hypothetical protein